MNPPSKRMQERLREAAEWRAMGASWPAVANQLGCRPEVCERWPDRYPLDWHHFLARAREKLAQETFSEALRVLLSHMRSRNEKVRHEAAKIVERHLGRGSARRVDS
jgi:hypothetical protein